MLKTTHPWQRVIPRSFNFCQNNDYIEMWHFLCYCLHSHLKHTDLWESKAVDTQGFLSSKRLLKLMLKKNLPFLTAFSVCFMMNFRTFTKKYVGTFLMLLPALLPKMRQLLRHKNHCYVRFLNSEILSVFMLEKNAPFWTTF